MPTIIHFINAGQGNMVLIEASDGKKFIFDCNITTTNATRVLKYLSNVIDVGTKLHAFICSHRDADHMRGIKILDTYFPIRAIWDSNYPGTTTTSSEYQDYMALRRQVISHTIEKETRHDFGRTRFRYLSARDDRLLENANAQGIVIKVEHRSPNNAECLSSAILTGDSDAQTWRNSIMQDYGLKDLSASILMAGHHGSITFFDDPNDDQHYYVSHIKAIKPSMTIVSVGDNCHGHPDSKALEFYEKYSKGSNKGNKVYRTDKQGTIRLVLQDEGGWSLKTGQ